MEQDTSEAVQQAKEILVELEQATTDAERESRRLIQHFAKKLESLEVERMKQRISHLNQQV